MIKTWNQFPDSVRKNLVTYYSPAIQKGDSVVRRIIEDFGIKSRIRVKDSHGWTELEFTDEQWTMFLLRFG